MVHENLLCNTTGYQSFIGCIYYKYLFPICGLTFSLYVPLCFLLKLYCSQIYQSFNVYTISLRNSSITWAHKDILLYFLLCILKFLLLTFKLLIRLKFIYSFMNSGMVWCRNTLFNLKETHFFSQHVLIRLSFPPMISNASSAIYPVSTDTWLCFWAPYTTLLVDFIILVPIAKCLIITKITTMVI